ncbi:aminotransferase class IV [Anaerotalea alkaliphila]|uniref:4-amino-4-deoxychorismate lyase n=1 Tax=Anaerotalea alkaliphila TaxID=2662126 RepID=A0A7X5HTT5_9FIRM|nr:aminotransferase class IV [Anaerotalea alkaliphila]NDL66545.1 hypothetical protein [Anaerotalea alkaliphila]
MWIINGRKTDDPKVELDGGYFFGYGAFETLLAEAPPVFLRMHLERLHRALDVLGIGRRVEPWEVEQAVELLSCRGQVLKVAVSEKNTVFSARPNPYRQSDYAQGAVLGPSSVGKNSLSPAVRIKSLNYLENLLENRKAKGQGWSDAFFLNEKGCVTETTTANLFFLQNGKLHTPALENGLLDGTVRRWLLEEGQGNRLPEGLAVMEGNYGPEAFAASEGVIMTNSVLGVMAVSSWEGRELPRPEVLEAVRRHYGEATEWKG